MQPEVDSTLTRAGFWRRFAATFLDIILLAAITAPFHGFFPLILCTYFICMWKFKGTTIGGVILGIKVVRASDAPISWEVALIRSLTSILSLIPLGLGFFWAAGSNRKSWHDKLAGTVVVLKPGISLV